MCVCVCPHFLLAKVQQRHKPSTDIINLLQVQRKAKRKYTGSGGKSRHEEERTQQQGNQSNQGRENVHLCVCVFVCGLTLSARVGRDDYEQEKKGNDIRGLPRLLKSLPSMPLFPSAAA